MKNPDFYENLAHIFNDDHRNLALKLNTQIQEESTARKSWYGKIIKGLNALGLNQETAQRNDPASQGKTTNNSSFLRIFVTLTERLYSELFPAGKILKGELDNPATLNESPDLKDHIANLEKFAQMGENDLNKKVLIKWDEWLPTISRGMQSAFLTGSAIFKIYQDDFFGHPTICHLKPEDVLIDRNAKSLKSAESIFHLYELSPLQIKAYENSGFFVKSNIFPSLGEIQANMDVRKERDKINNIDDSSTYNKENYQLASCYIWLTREDFNDPYIMENPFYDDEMKRRPFPYRCEISLMNPTFLNVTRAWLPNITNEIERDLPLVQMTYLPGESIWGMGLTDVLLQTHERLNTIQKELELALRYNSSPFGFVFDDYIPKNTTINIEPGKLYPLKNANLGSINEAFKEWKFSSPDPMFYEYFLKNEADAQSIVGISDLKPESISNIAASTLFALLDEQSKPMSAVLLRFSQAINQMLDILKNIMGYENGQKLFGDGLSGLTNEQVYKNPINFISICDPSLSNSALRVLQMQTVLEAAIQNPDIHDMYAIYSRFHQALRINNPEKLLKTKEELAQSAQEQAQGAQAQAQAAQAQQDIQNQILKGDVDVRMQKNTQDYQIAVEKLKLDQEKIRNNIRQADQKSASELEKQLLQLQQQEKIEQARFFQVYSKYLTDRAKLMNDTGIVLPVNPMNNNGIPQ